MILESQKGLALHAFGKARTLSLTAFKNLS